MLPNADVTALFNQFAGREVPMREDSFTFKGREYKQLDLADRNDATVRELEQHAKDNGLSLRLWWNGVAGTADYRLDRVNAHIEKEADGKYRIAPRFTLG